MSKYLIIEKLMKTATHIPTGSYLAPTFTTTIYTPKKSALKCAKV